MPAMAVEIMGHSFLVVEMVAHRFYPTGMARLFSDGIGV